MAMEKNVRKIKLIDDVNCGLEDTIMKLEEIWVNIGFPDEQKEQRCQTIGQHVKELLSEMVSEEYTLEEKIKLNIKEYEKELEKLYSDLREVVPEIADLKLAELETKLRNDVDILNKKKYDRLKCLRRLRKEELELCDYLVMPQVDINFVGCPTQEQLRELEQSVVMLKAEKVARTNTFEKLKVGVAMLQMEMDIGPENESKIKILDGTVDKLSKEYIKSLEQLHTKLNNEYITMLDQIEEKHKEFTLLWDRLREHIDESEKSHIQELPVKNTVHKLELLNTNIELLNGLKQQHLMKFINAIKDELVIIWDKCFFGEEQRKNCLAYYNENYSEESLAYHENELSAIKEHYKNNKDLFKLISKREALWEEKLKLEDSTVLDTRGGALLKSLNKKQRIEKHLPKFEKDLNSKIKLWEAEKCKSFMYKDCTYLEHIELQKAQYEMDQKLKRDLKQLAKKNELSEEMQYGSKRKCGTPTRTPTKPKFSRIDSTLSKKGSCNKSVFGNMNNTRNIYKSPMSSKIKLVGKSANKGTPGSAKSTNNGTLGSSRINEKNENTYTHSSLKKQASKQKKKVIGSKLCTEHNKKRRSRRSIQKNRVLKEKVLNSMLETNKDFSGISLIKPDSPDHFSGETSL